MNHFRFSKIAASVFATLGTVALSFHHANAQIVNPYRAMCDSGDVSSCQRADQFDRDTAGLDVSGHSVSESDRRQHEQEQIAGSNRSIGAQSNEVFGAIGSGAGATNMYQAAVAAKRGAAAAKIAIRTANMFFMTACMAGVVKMVTGKFLMGTMFMTSKGIYLFLYGKKMTTVNCSMAALTAAAGKAINNEKNDDIIRNTRCNDRFGTDCGGDSFAPDYVAGAFPYDWDGDGIPNDQDPSPGRRPYRRALSQT